MKKSNTTESEINKTLNALKKSRKDALSILKKLNNSKHYLISSCCISKNGAMMWNHTDTSELKMKNLSENLIENDFKSKFISAIKRCVELVPMSIEATRISFC